MLSAHVVLRLALYVQQLEQVEVSLLSALAWPRVLVVALRWEPTVQLLEQALVPSLSEQVLLLEQAAAHLDLDAACVAELVAPSELVVVHTDQELPSLVHAVL